MVKYLESGTLLYYSSAKLLKAVKRLSEYSKEVRMNKITDLHNKQRTVNALYLCCLVKKI